MMDTSHHRSAVKHSSTVTIIKHHNPKRYCLSISKISVVVFLGFCTLRATARTHVDTYAWVDESENILLVRIADNDYTRIRGLMFTPYILPFEGMLFVFNPERPVAFWMKNTIIPLDIRFYDSIGKQIAHYPYTAPCLQKICPEYPAYGHVRYVIEQRPQRYTALFKQEHKHSLRRIISIPAIHSSL